jgi:hypothetical protein
MAARLPTLFFWLAPMGALTACSEPLDPGKASMPAPDAAAAAPVVASPSTSAPASTPGRCFGDSPPELLAQQQRPRDLFATGKEVLWDAGGAMHRLDLATGRPSTFDAHQFSIVKAADSRDVFGVDGQASLLAIDLASGQSRVVTRSDGWIGGAGPLGMVGVMVMFQAEYALDGDYIVAAWRQNQAAYGFYSQGNNAKRMKGPHDLGYLGRVKRDGTSPPEYLGPGPDGHFVVSDGYAYWGSRFEGMKRRRLVPGAANELVVATPDVAFEWTLGVADGKLYFAMLNPGSPRTVSVASVPVDRPEDAGAAQPRVHVPAAALDTWYPAVVDGKCVYLGGPGGVKRANLEDGTVQTLIEGHPVPGDTTVLYNRFVATDGRYLYWADYGGDRVVRWGR